MNGGRQKAVVSPNVVGLSVRCYPERQAGYRRQRDVVRHKKKTCEGSGRTRFTTIRPNQRGRRNRPGKVGNAPECLTAPSTSTNSAGRRLAEQLAKARHVGWRVNGGEVFCCRRVGAGWACANANTVIVTTG